jgi:4-amino-4-deoxy-L-arabinose transferase-like glycosyltransferase
LSGGKFAQALAGLTIIFCGTVLGVSGYFSMNSFDILLSSMMFYFLIRLIKTGDTKNWIYLGIIFGIGLQNKLSFLFLGFGLAVGLILTKHRIQLKSKQLWLGAGLAFLFFLPNIIWQIANDFPTLEFMRNAAEFKNQPMSLLEFTTQYAMLELNPGFVIFVLIAIYYLLFNKDGRQFLIIGLIFFTVYLVFVLNNGKPYYMGVLFPVMLAAGAVGTDFLIKKYLKNWVQILVLVSIVPSAVFVTPFAIPILDVNNFLKFSNFTGHKTKQRRTVGAWRTAPVFCR